jgi:type II secretory pathway pseudopilin PulG
MVTLWQEKRSKPKQWRAGFTLIELFIVVGILSLVVGGIFAVMNVADKSWHSDMGLLDLQQQARLAMDGMVREIRQADPSQNIIIGSGGSSLQFYIANITDSTASPINYNLSSSQIIREHPLGVNKILANDISALNFSWVSNTTSCLQVQVRASKTVKQRVLTFPLLAPLVEEVKLRNE